MKQSCIVLVVKVYFKFVVLTYFLELSRRIPMIVLVDNNIIILNCKFFVLKRFIFTLLFNIIR